MFTGIVEERGTVAQAGTRLGVHGPKVAEDSAPGASVAVNGVCLTVVDRTGADDDCVLWFDVSEETLARSTLRELRAGDPVNLERPVTLLTRMGGHLVQGHVDGVGRVVETPRETGETMTIEVPEGLERYLVEKGSVAVDGVSLTVASLEGRRITVALVPHTLAVTTLGVTRRRAPVNIEVDVMARYAESFLRRDA